ncbi:MULTISPECIES: hypothetical protein [unclassified Streptomyces]|uniref:hypothetical protein n=1 Tax=unclassified Streptomyces TaxID=2593676 RepID=UPI0035D8ED95
MTTATDDTTGELLAESLLQDIGDDRMRAATRLLGVHGNGYWLRRFTEDQELSEAADQPLIDRSGTHPQIDWDSVGFLLTALDAPSTHSSASEVAVLQFAASLMGRCNIQLQHIIDALDHAELQRAAHALHEAAAADSDRG